MELRVTGYQFPDDPALRYSWHMVEGSAACPDGSWTFRYAALTCDETPRVASWLRSAARAAAGGEPPAELRFLEPDLSMSVTGRPSGLVALEIGLDLEFSPPWEYRRRAGDPYVVQCTTTPRRLEEGAAQWEREIAPYPDAPAASGTRPRRTT
ncbi:hypothetical protein BJF79_25415 [Actinomadura sp. CNU-125]|uniref:WapI family immunity protein n=1 Tax=Actinomadura sp. CNU-125 TaxID=1904961 RepID=UPI0009674EF1|nr:hypothetical protein [Actinomadura sp. CNU-125]OLT10907.1 hypothetical protein BJF79_25415 [Actinomadura sp. CNU-125]